MRGSRTSALFSRETHKVMYVREIAVSFRVMTIEVSQSEEEEGDRGGFLLFFRRLFPSIPNVAGSHSDNQCRRSPPSLVHLLIQPVGLGDSLGRPFPRKKSSAIAGRDFEKPRLLAFH